MITIDYSVTPYIINVPKSYTVFVSTDPLTGLELRQMDLTVFAQDIGDLQDDTEGAWAPTAYVYTAPVLVGGVQLAPVVVITSFYVVQFENLQYAVNLVGANTNVQDITVVNQVSIRPNNSAGLIITAGGGGGGVADWTTPEKKQIRDALGIDGDKRVARGGQLQKKSEYPDNSTVDTTYVHSNDSNN